MTTAELLDIVRNLYLERSKHDTTAATQYVALLSWPVEKLTTALENEMLGDWADIDADGIRAKARELVAALDAGRNDDFMGMKISAKGGHES